MEQYGKKHVWIAKPEYVKAFNLPQSIPSALAAELALAKEADTVPNGISLPSFCLLSVSSKAGV